jgi:hypothetical protein
MGTAQPSGHACRNLLGSTSAAITHVPRTDVRRDPQHAEPVPDTYCDGRERCRRRRAGSPARPHGPPGAAIAMPAPQIATPGSSGPWSRRRRQRGRAVPALMGGCGAPAAGGARRIPERGSRNHPPAVHVRDAEGIALNSAGSRDRSSDSPGAASRISCSAAVGRSDARSQIMADVLVRRCSRPSVRSTWPPGRGCWRSSAWPARRFREPPRDPPRVPATAREPSPVRRGPRLVEAFSRTRPRSAR